MFKSTPRKFSEYTSCLCNHLGTHSWGTSKDAKKLAQRKAGEAPFHLRSGRFKFWQQVVYLTTQTNFIAGTPRRYTNLSWKIRSNFFKTAPGAWGRWQLLLARGWAIVKSLTMESYNCLTSFVWELSSKRQVSSYPCRTCGLLEGKDSELQFHLEFLLDRADWVEF